MIKRTLITLALGMASSSFAAVAALPSDRQYDSIVTLQTGSSSDDLNAILQALGKSVGLTVVTQDIPAKGVNFDVSGKPFRDVWGLLLQVNDLDYELLPNGMVLVGPTAVVAKVRPPAPVAQPDSGPTPVREVYTVNGDPEKLSAYLRAEFPKVLVNAVGKNLTVTATPSEQTLVKQLLGRVDQQAEGVSTKSFSVAGNAQELAKVLSSELSGTRVSVVDSVILVTGTEAQQNQAQSILAAIDKKADAPIAESVERRFYTVNGDPGKLSELLNKEVKGVVATALVDKDGKAVSKTLIVTGTQAQHKDVVGILAALDKPQIEQISQEKRFYTVSGNPAELIQALVREVPGIVATPIADASGNTLSGSIAIVASLEQHGEVAQLLKAIDKPPVVVSAVVERERQSYTVNGDPVALVALLKKQFSGVDADAVVGLDGKAVSQVIAVTATPEQQDSIGELLAQVDSPEEAVKKSEVQKTFVLSNAKAESVKTALEAAIASATSTTTSTSSGTQGGTGSAGGAGGAGGASTTTRSVPSVQIISDVRTNTLVLRGIKESVDRLAELIPVLDKKAPVVNVQVRIQEVSETGVRSLGLDWTAGVGNFVTKLFSGSLTAVFDATQSMVGFNIGASLTASEQQGFSKRVDEANLMIESSNEERVEAAIPKLVSGGKLKINLPGTGGSQAIKETFDYGVIVEIPKLFIDGDGLVHMKLNAKVTNFSTPPTDPTFINATNREAQTTMTLKPGQTVMLGGLLTTQERNSSTGIPFLSSIPIIGNFFKKSEMNNEKTQLMLVVTANPVE
ncbi:MAG: secretin N-terminal domain-containing protein [Deinococcaceae bacterium]